MSRLALAGLAAVALAGLGVGAPAQALTNQLKSHPSPYLALHADDPVAWQDWGEAAVARARREDKLLFLSIGYFSCHWCHVMQRESYQNAEIAAFVNRHLVPVKIDRELEPALDARLIEFAEATRGMGGWPLNVFVTPDGYPLFALLYAPPQEFSEVVRRLQGLWAGERAALLELARTHGSQGRGPGPPETDARRAEAYARKLVSGALSLADPVHGGFGDQSKFPSVPQLEFLLERERRAPDAKLREFLIHSLDEMASRGLRDHLGGGFFRYTVDPSWKTPHFEKMLYDNALLAGLYLRAAATLGRADYREVARETLDFMVRELRSGDALIASLSALDAQGVEGGYYLWERAELGKRLAADERRAFEEAFGIKDAAPFEAGYLPMPSVPIEELARNLKRPTAETARLLAGAQAKLRAARTKRELPRDGKLLAGWNGLALSAFADAARAFGDERYRQMAVSIRGYLAATLWDGKRLKRAVDGGRALGAVSVEDYAYVSRGLLDYARLTGKAEDYRLALAVTRGGWERFYSATGWRLGDTSLIKAELGRDAIADGPMPSPSAVLIATSLALATELKDAALRRQALGALNSAHVLIDADPFWYATHVGAMLDASPRS